MRCIYCDNKKLYEIKTGQLKCSRCKRKFSLKKLKQNQNILECFCNDLTINQTKDKLSLNYITVSKKYKNIREQICFYLEEQYQGKEVLEYDEYIYLEKSKKKIKENIFNSQNFLTFNYEQKVYNILMPNLLKFKEQFLDDDLNQTNFNEFSKFMMFNKIAKIKNKDNIISRFWNFFEESIVRYKGVNSENFFYYLKEIEFKFNYKKKEQIKILNSLIL